jgi:hypothetical protein
MRAVFLTIVQGAVLTGALLAFCGVATAQQGQCPSGMNACAAGPNGPGGCYRPGHATCSGGAVCSSGESFCSNGQGGGDCYRPPYYRCVNGVLKPTGLY